MSYKVKICIKVVKLNKRSPKNDFILRFSIVI